jgi:hypothetical protein
VRHSDAVTGGPGAIMLRDSAGPIEPGDDWFAIMENVASLGTKDLSQALELAAELGVDTPLASAGARTTGGELGLPEGEMSEPQRPRDARDPRHPEMSEATEPRASRR